MDYKWGNSQPSRFLEVSKILLEVKRYSFVILEKALVSFKTLRQITSYTFPDSFANKVCLLFISPV